MSQDGIVESRILPPYNQSCIQAIIPLYMQSCIHKCRGRKLMCLSCRSTHPCIHTCLRMCSATGRQVAPAGSERSSSLTVIVMRQELHALGLMLLCKYAYVCALDYAGALQRGARLLVIFAGVLVATCPDELCAMREHIAVVHATKVQQVEHVSAISYLISPRYMLASVHRLSGQESTLSLAQFNTCTYAMNFRSRMPRCMR